MLKTLNLIERITVYALVILVPLVVLPIFPNAFTTIKLVTLTLGVAILLALKTIRLVVEGKFEISASKFDVPVLIIGAAYLLSTILRTPNKMEAILLPGTASIFIAAIFFYFLINQLRESEKGKIPFFLFVTGLFVSIFSLIPATGIFENVTQLPLVFRNPSFSTLGGNLPVIIFLATVLPLSLEVLLKEKDSAKKILYGAMVGIVTLGILGNIYLILPGKPNSPRLTDMSTSWSITVDALKESPILGVGPGNYVTAFNRYRPLTYNQTELWSARFSSARNLFFTIMTEGGLLATAGMILILVSIYRDFQKGYKENKLVGWGYSAYSKLASLVILVLLFAIFPATLTLIFLFFVLLALNSKTTKTVLNLSAQAPSEVGLNKQSFASRVPALLVAIPFTALIIAYLIFGARFAFAEFTFNKSLQSLTANEATNTYDQMLKAINLNPTVDRYHASFAQINFALANSLAVNKPAEEITDQDRANISQLIQQAIQEGKAVVVLNPARSGSWELLAQIYRSIIPFAEGSDAFSIQAFQQAIALDPINPNLRISLGGIYYAQGDYENAINSFRLAVAAKPDLANTHYNLAIAYQDVGDIQKAIDEMTIVLSLVDRDSPDYELAMQILESLESQQPVEEVAGTDELIPPQPAEEPVVEPPLELPEDAEPPTPEEEEPQASPSPVSSPTPTPLP